MSLAPAGAQALPSNTPDQAAISTNGEVKAIARSGGLTYIGGEFDELRAQTGSLAVVGAANGKRTGPFPEADGIVYAIAPDGAGGFYIGGEFNTVGGVPRRNIAHLLADGSVDPAFNPNADERVRAIAVSGSEVYVGGGFGNIGGLQRRNIAKLSATTGNAFSGFNPDANQVVRTLAVSGSELYVGGHFTNIGGLARNGIAKLSTASGNAFSGWNPNAQNGIGGNSFVYSIAISGAVVYIGGTFEQIGLETRNKVAKLSATSGNAFSGFAPVVDADVNAVAVSGDEVFIGGVFTNVNGQARYRIAKLSGTDGSLDATFTPNANEEVVSLAVSGTQLFAGGLFTNIAGQTRNRVAKLSTTSGLAFALFDVNANGPIRALALSGTTLAAGGNFTEINTVTRNHIAALDANGTPTDWNPNINGGVWTIAADGASIYAGGAFTTAGGQPRKNIVKLSATSGQPFATFSAPVTTDGTVFALAVDGSVVYAGGGFDNIGGLARKSVAKLSATSGNAFAAFDATNADHAVDTMALSESGTELYVGGRFTAIGGQTPRNRIAKLSTASGNAFSAWNPDSDSYVQALVPAGADLYVGGGYTAIGGQPRNFIADLSTASGNAFSAFNPNAQSNVLALALSGSVLYAGGDFYDVGTIGGLPRNHLAALSTESGNAFSGFNPNMTQIGGRVSSLAADGTSLYAGGTFETVGGRPREGYAQFSTP